jgi:hypothetical protein
MKKQVNKRLMAKWVSVIGRIDAIELLMKATGLSFSAIDKIIRDKYHSDISFLAKKAIAERTQIPQEELFYE